MHRIEKRLVIASLIFVALYIGAIVLTLTSRPETPPAEPKLESTSLDEATRPIVLAEVLPPMLFLFTLAICFVLVRKKQQLARRRMDAFEKEGAPVKDSETGPSI